MSDLSFNELKDVIVKVDQSSSEMINKLLQEKITLQQLIREKDGALKNNSINEYKDFKKLISSSIKGITDLQKQISTNLKSRGIDFDNSLKQFELNNTIQAIKDNIYENKLMNEYRGNNRTGLLLSVAEIEKNKDKYVDAKKILLKNIETINANIDNPEYAEKLDLNTKRLEIANRKIKEYEEQQRIPNRILQIPLDNYEQHIENNESMITNGLLNLQKQGFENIDIEYPSVSIGNIEQQCDEKGLEYWIKGKEKSILPIKANNEYSLTSYEMEQILIQHSLQNEETSVNIENTKKAGPLYRILHRKEINKMVNVMFDNNDVSKDFKKMYSRDFARLLKAGITVEDVVAAAHNIRNNEKLSIKENNNKFFEDITVDIKQQVEKSSNDISIDDLFEDENTISADTSVKDVDVEPKEEPVVEDKNDKNDFDIYDVIKHKPTATKLMKQYGIKNVQDLIFVKDKNIKFLGKKSLDDLDKYLSINAQLSNRNVFYDNINSKEYAEYLEVNKERDEER